MILLASIAGGQWGWVLQRNLRSRFSVQRACEIWIASQSQSIDRMCRKNPQRTRAPHMKWCEKQNLKHCALLRRACSRILTETDA
jgi:hypothetical protein